MIAIDGETAVVTGAGQGNGAAIAKGLARHGALVAVCDINRAAADAIAKEIIATGGTARAFAVDVSDAVSVTELSAKVEHQLGTASILVNNAGIIRRSALDAASFEDDWHAMMAVNATGAMLMTRAFIAQLEKNAGRIVNIGSIMSVTAGPSLAGYAASKGALLQLTRALAHELAPLGIRVNAIAPGVIETPMTQTTRDSPETLDRFIAHTPMGRVGQPDELAGPVLFLCSNLSTYVTGVLLPVDGGYLCG